MNDFEKNLLNSLGTKLRTHRLQKNYSQEKFAELTELDRTYISGLERGKRNPSYLIIKRLCDVLEITPNDLFFGECK
jgi:transcriptional regulator with XRE-family HTH domain